MRWSMLALLFPLLAPSALAQQGFVGDGPVTGPTRSTVIPGVPATIANGGTFTSACLVANQARAFDVFAALTGVATLQVQRYADIPISGVGGCSYPVGAAVPSTALTLATGTGCPASGADFCGDVASNDGLPFQGIKVIVHNTFGATNTVANLILNQAAE